MLVIAMETGSWPDGSMRWAGRRHDDDRADATSGSSSAELFDAVFHALHDGEQVALGLDCPLTMPASADNQADAGALAALAEPAVSRPGLAELGYLLAELGTWRPWTTVSTSLTWWKANTSILVWQAVPAPGSDGGVPASTAADSFFRQFPAAVSHQPEPTGTVVNLAAAAARRAGLFIDPSELAQPTLSITVTAG
jgi:hypothetical protein